MVSYTLEVQMTYGSALCNTTKVYLLIRKVEAHSLLYITKRVYQKKKRGREKNI